MSWTLAPALAALRSEINTRWPNRDKSSDGTIGDLAHQHQSKSEHNPDSEGVVRAIDITARGIDVDALLNAAIGDPRVHYVIYRGRICSRTYNWTWRPSSGHEHHIHISLRNRTSEQAPWDSVHQAAHDTNPWFKTSTTTTAGDDMPLTNDEIERIADRTRDKILKTEWGGPGDTFSGRVSKLVEYGADAAYYSKQAASNTRPVHRPSDPAADSDGDLSLRQEIADTKTLALANKNAVAELVNRTDRILALLEGGNQT